MDILLLVFVVFLLILGLLNFIALAVSLVFTIRIAFFLVKFADQVQNRFNRINIDLDEINTELEEAPARNSNLIDIEQVSTYDPRFERS